MSKMLRVFKIIRENYELKRELRRKRSECRVLRDVINDYQQREQERVRRRLEESISGLDE